MYLWTIAKHTYEGFPLYLRRPVDVDTPDHRMSFPHLAVIKHTFTKRFPDGRPEPDYNETLGELDHEVLAAFTPGQFGVPVLVETFAGKRNYYFYVADGTDVSAIAARIARHHPDETITRSAHPNDRWAFLDKYAAEFF